MLVVARFVDVSVWANLRAIWPPLAAATLMMAAVRLVFLLDPSETSRLCFLLAIVVGGCVYLAMLWLLDRYAVGDVVSMGRSFLRRDRPAEIAH